MEMEARKMRRRENRQPLAAACGRGCGLLFVLSGISVFTAFQGFYRSSNVRNEAEISILSGGYTKPDGNVIGEPQPALYATLQPPTCGVRGLPGAIFHTEIFWYFYDFCVIECCRVNQKWIRSIFDELKNHCEKFLNPYLYFYQSCCLSFLSSLYVVSVLVLVNLYLPDWNLIDLGSTFGAPENFFSKKISRFFIN